MMESFAVDQQRYLSSKIHLDKVESYGTESIRYEAKAYRIHMKPKGDLADSIEYLSNVKREGLVIDGKYGKFYKGNLNNVYVAIHPLTVTDFKTDELWNRRDYLARSQHKSVIRLFATYLDFDNLAAVFITQDIKSTLRSFYEDFIPKRATARLMIQLVQALEFVHDKNIILVDINPENINITLRENLVLSYFGQAIDLNSKKIEQPSHRLAGLPEYMDIDAMECKYSKSSDIFSAACVLFEIWNNNSYIACPKECILLPPERFYKQVLQHGRPFIRKNSETNKYEMYTHNGTDRENLLTRLEQNLKISCQEKYYQDFYDVFSSMLNADSGVRMGANDILRTRAFGTLGQIRTDDLTFSSTSNQLCCKTFIQTQYNEEDILKAKVRFLNLFGLSCIYCNGILPPNVANKEVGINEGPSDDSHPQQSVAGVSGLYNFQADPLPTGPSSSRMETVQPKIRNMMTRQHPTNYDDLSSSISKKSGSELFSNNGQNKQFMDNTKNKSNQMSEPNSGSLHLQDMECETRSDTENSENGTKHANVETEVVDLTE